MSRIELARSCFRQAVTLTVLKKISHYYSLDAAALSKKAPTKKTSGKISGNTVKQNLQKKTFS